MKIIGERKKCSYLRTSSWVLNWANCNSHQCSCSQLQNSLAGEEIPVLTVKLTFSLYKTNLATSKRCPPLLLMTTAIISRNWDGIQPAPDSSFSQEVREKTPKPFALTQGPVKNANAFQLFPPAFELERLQAVSKPHLLPLPLPLHRVSKAGAHF